MVQVLHISNGKTINEKLASDKGRVQELIGARLPAYRMIEDVYLSALSRYPTDDELSSLLPLVAEAPADESRLVMEDLFWSVLSSREFLFQH
jgi:hypothetical protein